MATDEANTGKMAPNEKLVDQIISDFVGKSKETGFCSKPLKDFQHAGTHISLLNMHAQGTILCSVGKAKMCKLSFCH